jgi:O-antigen/teichoic acid export membrane protein
MSSKPTTAARGVLTTGAVVFGLSAIFLLILPGVFLDLLGLPPTPDLQWAMRMIAITLIALTGNMLSVSLYGNDRGVLFSARVMRLSALGLGALTILIPVELNWFSIAYAGIGFGFFIAYTVVIFLIKRHLKKYPEVGTGRRRAS